MTALQQRRIEVDGQRTHYLCSDTGSGVPLLMLHGVGVSSRSLRGAGERFAQSVPVLIPDLPGHGRSSDPSRMPDTAGMARAVAKWLEVLAVDRIRLFGQSFGCQVAVELAVARPDLVERVVLQGPTVDPHARTWPAQFLRWSANGRREGPGQLVETVRGWAQTGLGRVVRTAHAAVHHPIEERLPLLDRPTLVVRGDRDPITSLRWAEEAATLVPQGRLLRLPGAAHTVTSTDPGRVVDAVLPFVRDGTPIGDRPPRS